jgi:hypothetical protein
MEEANLEGVGTPVPVSGLVEPEGATTTSPADKVEALRRVHVFADLPDDQLQWFADHTEDVHLSPGDVFFRKGEPADSMAVYLEGEVRAYRDEQAPMVTSTSRARESRTRKSVANCRSRA